ncbi:MAG: pilus assembly protein TadG-related protein, partial [Ilumatobacteraceae bacterium]
MPAPARRPCRRDVDRGSAALLVLVVATTIGLAAMLGLIVAGEVLVDGNRARAAADAAALAGVEHGRARP